jgi:hypothetical protein
LTTFRSRKHTTKSFESLKKSFFLSEAARLQSPLEAAMQLARDQFYGSVKMGSIEGYQEFMSDTLDTHVRYDAFKLQVLTPRKEGGVTMLQLISREARQGVLEKIFNMFRKFLS